MTDSFDFPLMVRDSLTDWKAQLRRRFPRAPEGVIAPLSFLFLPFAIRFALEMRKFHSMIGEVGLGAASLALLRKFYDGVALSSDTDGTFPADRPTEGRPLLVLANHPGVVDTLALFHVLETAYGIRDFYIVAKERDFFAAMPAVRKRLISVPPDGDGRASVLGRIEAALLAGRSVVLYPSGSITGDPCLAPEIHAYEDLLGTWSPSVGLLIARELLRSKREGRSPFVVLPLLCGGVLPQGIAEARWMGRGIARRDREALAVGAVLAFRSTRNSTIRMRAGTPLDPETDLVGLGPKEAGEEVYRRTLETARRLAEEFRP